MRTQTHLNPFVKCLHALEDSLLELALNLLAGLVGVGLAVEVEESTKVELGGLEELDLADVDVLERVDALGGLLDLTADDLGDELLGKLRKSAAAGLTLHDVGHLLADLSDLRAAGVCGLLDLVGASLGEGNAEQTEEVVIGGLDDDVGLDQGLPLADERTELVGGEVETVEVGQAVLALNLVDSQADLAEGVVFILLEIGERNLEDTALKSVVGVLETGGTVDEGLANISDGEGGRSLEVVPVLLGEAIGAVVSVKGSSCDARGCIVC